MAEQDPYDEGRAAFLAGAGLCAAPHIMGTPEWRMWRDGWLAQEAAARGLWPGCVVDARPRPKIVQIATVPEGDSSMPALFALRDDGTLWVISLVKNDGGRGAWARYPLPPGDEAADGR